MSFLTLNCRCLVRAGLVVMAGIMDFKISFLTSTQSRFQTLNFKLCLFLTASPLVRQVSQSEHSKQQAALRKPPCRACKGLGATSQAGMRAVG